jgi:hypothetical protein
MLRSMNMGLYAEALNREGQNSKKHDEGGL